MSDYEGGNHKDGHHGVGFWIALLRGVLVIILGLVLIFNPEKTQNSLFNAMGLFWLTSGIILLRHTYGVFGSQTDRVLGKRLALVLGVVGILTGLLVVSRNLTRNWVGETVFFHLLGAVILLTGVLHLLGEFRIGRVIKLKRTTAQKILAVFEIVLGALLVISPLERGPGIYWTATIWALIGGGLFIYDAVYQQARVNREGKTLGKPPEIDKEYG